MNKNLIDNLVDDLEPVKVLWPAHIRLIIWMGFFLALTGLGMYLRQDFRQAPMTSLFSSSMHSISLWLGLAAVFMLGLNIFKSIIPGEKISKWIRYSGLALLVTSFALCIFELFHPFIAASSLGARPFCNLEVLVYGVVGSIISYIFLRKGMLQLSGKTLFYLTITSGLVPALIMQTACKYEPMHNILHHFMPILGIGLINGMIAYKLKD
jgi:uncharacterized membrane protein